MTTSYLPLSIPSSPGVGASVAVSDMEEEKTFVITGPDIQGLAVVVEGSADGGGSFAPLIIFNSPVAAPEVVKASLTHVRARLLRGNNGGVLLYVGGETGLTGVFDDLPTIDSGGSPGPTVDTSTMIGARTVVVGGNYTSPLVVEGSQDGTTFTPVVTFLTGAPDTARIEGEYAYMRTISNGGAPSVSVGSVPFSAGGGTSLDPDVIADWDVDECRYFLIDNDSGSDTNLGYVDAAPGSTIVPTGLAKKTITGPSGLLSILPRAGAGRIAVVMFKNRTGGANYQDPSSVNEGLDLSGVQGYKFFIVRGSTDLTNSTTDRILCGGITASAGPNGDGSWTSAGGSTVDAVTVAAGTVPAESVPNSGSSSGVLGFRIRFTGNVTAALTNVTRMIQRNTASEITFGVQLGTAPAAGDTFFIERPGVRVTAYCEAGILSSGGVDVSATGTTSEQVAPATVGIGVTNTAVRSFIIGNEGRSTYTFCEMVNVAAGTAIFNKAVTGRVDFRANYFDETGTSRTVGTGFRADAIQLQTTAPISTVVIGPSGICILGTAVSAADATFIPVENYIAIQGGSYFGRGCLLSSGGASARGDVIGAGASVGTNRRLRFNTSTSAGSLSALCLRGPIAPIDGCEFENIGASAAAIRFGHTSGILTVPDSVAAVYRIDNCVAGASGGVAGVAIDVKDIGAMALIGTRVANTLSGTAGEIRLADGSALTTYAALARTNVVDSAGNNIVGTGGQIVKTCKLVSNQSGGALVVGQIVRGNGTSGQVTSAIADSDSNAVAIGAMVTPPASGAAGYIATDTPSVNFTAAPTPGARAYLSQTNTGEGTTTLPGGGTIAPIGKVLSTSGSTGVVVWNAP